MKKYMIIIIACLVLAFDLVNTPTFPGNPFKTEESEAEVKYVQGYTRSNGTYVSGHYKDTSGDGSRYNNAEYLGY